MIIKMANTWNTAIDNNFGKTFIPLKEIDISWKQFFKQEIKKDYFKQMYKNLKQEYTYCINNNINIYPPIDQVFAVFKLCPLNQIKVIILGQDPYINERNIRVNNTIKRIPQACGLAFSVSPGITPPPSLKNIYKELSSDTDVNFQTPTTGNLNNWVKNQGVFLLNCALTVRSGKSNSHAKYWQKFTENVIKYISSKTNNKVFILWGRFAQSKKKFIDIGENKNKHHVIECPHPSPYSARYGFFGSKCFSQCNNYLTQSGSTVVDWNDFP